MTSATWSLPPARTPGPLLTAEPGRVTGTSASVRTPGLLPPGLSQPPGSGQCRESACDPAARRPAFSSPSPLKRSPRPAQRARGPGGGGGARLLEGVVHAGWKRSHRELLSAGLPPLPRPRFWPKGPAGRDTACVAFILSRPQRLRGSGLTAQVPACPGRLQACRSGGLDPVSGRAHETSHQGPPVLRGCPQRHRTHGPGWRPPRPGPEVKTPCCLSAEGDKGRFFLIRTSAEAARPCVVSAARVCPHPVRLCPEPKTPKGPPAKQSIASFQSFLHLD